MLTYFPMPSCVLEAANETPGLPIAQAILAGPETVRAQVPVVAPRNEIYEKGRIDQCLVSLRVRT